MVVAAYVGCLTHVWRLVQCRWANLDTLDGGTAHLVATRDHMVVDIHRMAILDALVVAITIHLVVTILDTLVDLDTTLVVTRIVVDVAWRGLVVLDNHMVGVACHQVVSVVPWMLRMTAAACSLSNFIVSMCQVMVSSHASQVT